MSGKKLLRVRHRLTAHHWRHDRKGPHLLGICGCGWTARWLRRGLRDRLREVPCLYTGHQWGEPEVIETGPVGFEDGKGEYLGTSRQCARCYRCEDC